MRPVMKRQVITTAKASIQTKRAAFARAPATVAMQKSRRAPIQSTSVNAALMAVPATNPRVTAMDNHAWLDGDIHDVFSTGITAVAENQSESAPSSARQIQNSMRHRPGSGMSRLL
jgi:hypothetical protein